jgi:hypothetical protein
MDQVDERVLVPVKLTDEMRERMRQIEDGPAKTYDEVWAEMLDAALIQPNALIKRASDAKIGG